mgnify:CR=1 FL=1
MTGADAVIQSLLSAGIDTMFGYPGGAIMPVYDSLYRLGANLNHILTRHEQGAIHAAQGYQRASNKLAIVLATSGPGATNLVTGLADAQIDSTALVCITGQVASPLLGTDAFQETDIISISNPVTKWNYQITEAQDIPEILAKAIYIAQSGRPGPVLIDITKDAQMEFMEFHYKPMRALKNYHPYPKIEIKDIEKAAYIINAAKKPMAIIGQGVILGAAEQELLEFLAKSNIPTASTLLGLSAISSKHPLFVGMVGMHGNYAPNIQTNNCDVLISIGMRFDDRVTGELDKYAKQAKVIHFDIDESEINKNVPTEVGIVGDVKQTLPFLTNIIEYRKHETWINSFEALYKTEFETIIQKQINPDGEQIRMAEVMDQLNQMYHGKAILVSDVGQHQMIVSRYAEFIQTRSHISSGGLGTMGFALPAAVGAKIGDPEREVIAVIGDGGFQMTCQELGTIMQSSVPVKVIILNNEYLGMVRQWQELFFDGRYASTEMKNPDFQKLASAYNIPSETVLKREELKKGLQRMKKAKGSYLLEVKVEQMDNVFPMVQTGASVSEVRLS